MKLSKRLQAIYDEVEKGSILLDIGCDHAYLAIQLFKNDVIKSAYLTDIHENALNIAKTNVFKYKFADKVKFYLGDGLIPVIENDYNTLTISGMGGANIISILSSSIDKLKNVKRIVLQPNNCYYELKKFLYKIGYHIIKEKYVEECEIVYNIITFEKGRKNIGSSKLFLGINVEKNKDYINFLKREISRRKKICSNLPNKYILKKIKTKYEMFLLENIIKKEDYFFNLL